MFHAKMFLKVARWMYKGAKTARYLQLDMEWEGQAGFDESITA